MNGKSKSIYILIAVCMLGTLFAVSAGAQGEPDPDVPGDPTTTLNVTPGLVDGNPTCEDLDYDFGFKPSEGLPASDTYTIPNVGDVTIDLNGTTTYFDWSSTFGIDAVIVKGGNDADAFVYEPPSEATGDTDLHAPFKADETPRNISHIEFCYDIEQQPETGRITIKKVTDPAGDQTDFGFEGSEGIDPFTLNDSGSQPLDLVPGTYTITELDPGEDWYVSQIECVYPDTMPEPSIGAQSVTIEDLTAGDEVTCTFYNTKVSTMIIEKQTIPDGAPDLFPFQADSEYTLSDGQSFTMITGPGSYPAAAREVLDLMPEGWSLTSIVCDDGDSTGNIETGEVTFNVTAGETVKCTFTNTKDQQLEPGNITVHKFNDLNGNGVLDDNEPGLGDWEMTLYSGFGCAATGELVASGHTGTDGNVSFSNLNPGTYSVKETAQPGWESTTDDCPDITLVAGGSETVYFGNHQQQPDVTIFKEQSLDNSSWTTETLQVSAGDTIFYQLTVTNLYYDAVDLILSDDLDNRLIYDSGWFGTDTDDPLEDSATLAGFGTLIFSFAATVADTVFPGDTLIENTAFVKLSSWNEWEPSNTVYARVTDAVPEPATVVFLGTGLLGIFVLGRRRRRQKK